jgi:hypothetical protein
MAKPKVWKVIGNKLVAKNLLSLAVKYPKAAASSLNHEAEMTMAAAKLLTPVRRKGGGTLRRSGKVSEHAQPAHLEATLSYGTNYALYVHEIPPPPQKSAGGRSASHQPPFGTGGQWKYLETPLNQRAKKFPKRIAVGIQMRVKSP